MSFIQDPRLRQRWNQISHNAETVTENAAAGIWTFQHRYITPCLGSLADAVDGCTSLCLGDREERARRARERDRRARRSSVRAEYVFDFYDDWDDDLLDSAADIDGGADGGSGAGAAGGLAGGLFGTWGGARSEDWDRLLAGSGSGRGRHSSGAATISSGDVVDQPRRKRGMSYGTRGPRRKASTQEDPTVIPSTTALGFLSRLPFRIGGTLRYKPSAANLREHPGNSVPHRPEERDPLLGEDAEDDHRNERSLKSRARSNTAGSGATSDSYRSRNDLFPSDGEGDEDAVPLDDEFAMALGRMDDRGSNKTRSGKGKRAAVSGDGSMSRTVSRTTVASSLGDRRASSTSVRPVVQDPPSLEDLRLEEEEAQRNEDEELERKRRAASQLAVERGLTPGVVSSGHEEPVREIKPNMFGVEHVRDSSIPEPPGIETETPGTVERPSVVETSRRDMGESDQGFVPARLPQFR
ncbi:hypothetical protein VTK73DRAFT_521 [Phialemonium thermophilum]|uniref:Uncharacterized protein n=1 Tax=Phialemonium thermophilum TaxID=223376 RepID=A0ABR3Y407_9PEZI